MYIGEDIIICRDGEEEAAINAWNKEREMSVKKLFEETITISIEKYDDLLKKAGKLEYMRDAYPEMFKARLYLVEKEGAGRDEDDTFETEIINE